MLVRGTSGINNHLRLEMGQTNSNLDQIALSSLNRISGGGILSNSSEIFDSNGMLDTLKFTAWEPSGLMKKLDILVSEEMPKILSLVVFSALDRFPKLKKGINLTNLRFFEEGFFCRGYVSLSGRNFRSGIDFSPLAAKNALQPWSPGLKTISPGISLGSYSFLATIGELVYSKINYESNFELLHGFTEAAGWSKTPTEESEKASYGDRKSIWYRKTGQFPTLTASFSPLDDFSETFVFYLVHNSFLAQEFPERYEEMKKVITYYDLI